MGHPLRERRDAPPAHSGLRAVGGPQDVAADGGDGHRLRRPFHDKVQREHAFGYEVDPEDLHGRQRQRVAEKRSQEEDNDFINRGREQKALD